MGALVLAVALPVGCSSAPPDRSAGPSTTASTPPSTEMSPRPGTGPPTVDPSTATPAVSSWANATGVRVRRAGWRLPTPLSREVVFDLGLQQILVTGGLTPGDRSSDRVWSVDRSTGRLSPQPGLTQPVHDAAGIVLQGSPTVLGGGGTSELRGVQRRDRSGHWHQVGQLPGSRSDLSAVAVPDGGLAIGGYDGATAARSVLHTATGRRFTEIARLPHGVRYAAVARSAGAVWVIGGEDGGAQLPWIQRLDPRSGKVTAAGRWPVGLGHAAAVAVGARILVLGGRTSAHQVTDAMWWFDPASGAVSRAGRLPYPVADAGLVVTGNAAYLVGGESPDFRRDVLEVRPTR